MGTIRINRLIGGSIVITTGGGSTPSEPTAPNGKVLYKTSVDGEWLESDAHISAGGTFNGFNEKSSAVAVIIPSKDASGNDVTGITDGAFYSYTNLTSVTIPDSVTSIGEEAFYDCSGLTSVTIGKGVTSIGTAAFGNCNSLPSITIPSSVTTFGADIILGCDNLHTMNLPGKTMDEVGELTQGAGNLDRMPAGEGDYMDYICSDGTISIVAEYDNEMGMYIWMILSQA